MIITIKISEEHAKILAECNNLSKTLNEAKKHCRRSTFIQDQWGGGERAQICLDELETIEPILNDIFRSIRKEILINDNNYRYI